MNDFQFRFPPSAIENPTDRQCYLIWTLYRAHRALTWDELVDAVRGMPLPERAMAISTIRPMFPSNGGTDR
jgi:hypothetical protein